MKRRDFLKNLSFSGNSHDTVSLTKGDGDRLLADLSEYTQPLDIKKVLHLLRRLSFAPLPEQIDQYVGKTAGVIVDEILGNELGPQPEPPDMDWVDKPFEDPLKAGNPALRFEIESNIKKAYREFNDWWIDLMLKDGVPLREKLVLFWSTVWAIEFTYDTHALNPPGLCYRNNQTLRKNRFGDYKQMALDITLDGAMLLYQSLQYSNRNTANENYMREMLELFTMGTGDIVTGDKNYTEGDIRQGSEVLTGWRTAAYDKEAAPNGFYTTWFSPNDHIIDSKEFMGNTIPARTEDENTEELVKNQEVKGLIDIFFSERSMAIGRFVSNKIYKYFVYSNPGAVPTDVLNSLAQTFIDNQFNTKSIFSTIFKSAHFYSDEMIGIQIKRPPEFIIGLQRMLGVEYAESRDAIFDLDQELYDPPNVGSWKGYHTWLSTKTVPLRAKYANEILALADKDKLIALAKKFQSYDNPGNLADRLTEYFLSNFDMIEQDRKDSYKAILLNGAEESAWAGLINNNSEQAGTGIRNLIKAYIYAPDFQLC